MLFLFLAVIGGLLIGAIAGRIAAARNKSWRPTFVVTSIISTVILFLIAFRLLTDNNVRSDEPAQKQQQQRTEPER